MASFSDTFGRGIRRVKEMSARQQQVPAVRSVQPMDEMDDSGPNKIEPSGREPSPTSEMFGMPQPSQPQPSQPQQPYQTMTPAVPQPVFYVQPPPPMYEYYRPSFGGRRTYADNIDHRDVEKVKSKWIWILLLVIVFFVFLGVIAGVIYFLYYWFVIKKREDKKKEQSI